MSRKGRIKKVCINKKLMFAFFATKVYSLVTTIALILIAFYRAFGSLWLSGSCRFEPSCSVYAEEAIRRYGFWAGGKIALGRLMRCRPGGPCGIDPVPDHRIKIEN